MPSVRGGFSDGSWRGNTVASTQGLSNGSGYDSSGFATGPNNYSQFFGTNNGSEINYGFGPDHFGHWASQQDGFSGFSAGLSTSSDEFANVCAAVESWIPDSGATATAHMTPNPNLVHGAQAYTGSTRVVVGNDLDRNQAPPHSA
ncbi:hypothetical protein L6452_33823 [Arctium lappa]|uniref:Uncharacterized protein n=1 Tax=Arctium lappa TaxID=4217 RepID=A0ACB8YFS0_ARCLA|nr:hypothetical protein L6452_33823 [Arctium lappa]